MPERKIQDCQQPEGMCGPAVVVWLQSRYGDRSAFTSFGLHGIDRQRDALLRWQVAQIRAGRAVTNRNNAPFGVPMSERAQWSVPFLTMQGFTCGHSLGGRDVDAATLAEMMVLRLGGTGQWCVHCTFEFERNGLMTAHAVGAHASAGARCWFFDPNRGVYEYDTRAEFVRGVGDKLRDYFPDKTSKFGIVFIDAWSGASGASQLLRRPPFIVGS